MTRSAAIFLATITMVFLLTANDTNGRPFAGGRAMPLHPGVAARPLAATARPVFHGQSARRLQGHVGLRHRARSGLGLWSWYDGYYPYDGYGTPYGASPYVPSDGLPYEGAPPPYPPPAPPVAAPPVIKVINIIPYRPGCDTEVEKVPWSNGSEKSIRIVRC
jgi:hypothetical protein